MKFTQENISRLEKCDDEIDAVRKRNGEIEESGTLRYTNVYEERASKLLWEASGKIREAVIWLKAQAFDEEHPA